ncbi:MAG: hypothetical protein C0616_12870 [Desulfuromonas sp.]|nr:MAG: hypothetical protein C0616_12870 [Desulfuromonas sp.]
MKFFLFTFFLPLLVASICGCSTPLRTIPQRPAPLENEGDSVAIIHEIIDSQSCRNIAYHQVPGLPFLRLNRFWQSQTNHPLSAETLALLLKVAREFDSKSVAGEISCLDSTSKSQLADRLSLNNSSTASILEQYEAGARILLRHHLTDPSQLLEALRDAKVPDNYSTTYRVLGLYPLIAPVFTLAVVDAYEERESWLQRPESELLNDGDWRLYSLMDDAPLSMAQAGELIRQTSSNPLGVPLPDEHQAQLLAATYAPTLIQQEETGADLWGRVDHNGNAPHIVTEEPTFYYYLDHGLRAGQPFLRINYVNWYPERTGEKTPWFEHGAFDGLTIGVSIDDSGQPFLLQVMNNCGCYLQYFPAVDSGLESRDVPWAPDPLLAQTLPKWDERHKPTIAINAGWHQVERLLKREPELERTGTYRLLPYKLLEQIPLSGGQSISLFDSQGVLPGSERIERFFFFPMGIPSVGSMKQRGHQPITLVGRAHYDDADWLDYPFSVKPRH